MERFPVFRSRDSEETRAFLDEKQFRFDMAPRQRPALGAQLNGVYLPSMYLGYIEYGGAAVATTATSRRSDYWIQIALRGNIEVAAGRDVIACDAAHAALERRAKPIAPADLRRVIHFIEANIDAPIG